MITYDEKKLNSHHHGYVRYYEKNPTRIEYTHEEVLEVLSLVAHSKWPDGQMSDDQCTLWDAVHRELDIPIPW